MNAFNDLVDKIKLNLSQSAKLSSVKFIDIDKEEKVPNPINNVYVSLGISKVYIKEGALGSYMGIGSDGEQYGNNSEINIEMRIFSPRLSGSKNCYNIFSKIYEELLYQKKEYNIESISCEKTTYNNDIFSFELICNIKLNVYLGYETDDINISDIRVEKRA